MLDKNYLLDVIEGADVQLNANGYNSHSKNECFNVFTNDFDILHVISGEYKYIINNAEYLSVPGDITVVGPRTSVSAVALNGSDTKQIYCHFSLLDKSGNNLSCSFDSYILKNEAYASLFEKYYASYSKDRQSGSVPLKCFCKLLFSDLLLSSEKNFGSFSRLNKPNLPEDIIKAIGYINAHLDTDISVSELSRLIGFNSSYFSRYFNKYIGMPPQKYINKVKMEYAKSLLLNSGNSLKWAAGKLGYSDSFVLSKKFKKYFGVSPSYYGNVKL